MLQTILPSAWVDSKENNNNSSLSSNTEHQELPFPLKQLLL
ncbi:11173_t:CDS:2 [Entrophospora sp. SA101]|nr:11173_t:CDS:2 [Entrophospora sp. SA101]